MNSNNRSKHFQKSKAAEPSARDKLSADFTKRLEEKWREKGDDVLEAAFKESPTKIAELIARLVSTGEPRGDGFDDCQDMESVGRKLLRQVGVPEHDATAEMVQEALAAQDIFIAKLQAIRDEAQGPMQ